MRRIQIAASLVMRRRARRRVRNGYAEQRGDVGPRFGRVVLGGGQPRLALGRAHVGAGRRQLRPTAPRPRPSRRSRPSRRRTAARPDLCRCLHRDATTTGRSSPMRRSPVDWTVVCAVLPKHWFVSTGSYHRGKGGELAIATRAPTARPCRSRRARGARTRAAASRPGPRSVTRRWVRWPGRCSPSTMAGSPSSVDGGDGDLLAAGDAGLTRRRPRSSPPRRRGRRTSRADRRLRARAVLREVRVRRPPPAVCVGRRRPGRWPSCSALADDETAALWRDLRLGYTESLGHPLLRREIASLYETVDARRRRRVQRRRGGDLRASRTSRSGPATTRSSSGRRTRASTRSPARPAPT